MTPLPSGAFRTKLQNTSLMGGTPTRPALQGAVQYARTLKSSGGRVVIGLVTDGAPSTKLCNNNDTPTLVNVATAARNVDGILTYAIGMDGSAKGNLDLIAKAGGTTTSVLIDAANASSHLAQTLNDIQSSFACEVALPSLQQDKTYAVDEVNVMFSVNGQGTTLQYSKECTNKDGWRYDDAANPTSVYLCEQACSRARASAGGTLDVKLGCKTEGESPR